MQTIGKHYSSFFLMLFCTKPTVLTKIVTVTKKCIKMKLCIYAICDRIFSLNTRTSKLKIKRLNRASFSHRESSNLVWSKIRSNLAKWYFFKAACDIRDRIYLNMTFKTVSKRAKIFPPYTANLALLYLQKRTCDSHAKESFS